MAPPAPADQPAVPGGTGLAGDPVAVGSCPGGSQTDGGAAGYASVRLLADRAAAVRPDFVVDAANAADVARICRALDGMPLAIELAAARLRSLSAAQLAQRLDARFVLLTGGSRTAAPRHQTLRAVVDWSWDLLSEPEQMLARRLAIFPAGATLAAAEQVCQDAALPAEAILPALFGLVEKSFLAVDGGGEPRYRMLETVRAYCRERLAHAGEEHKAWQGFTGYLVRLAETADPLLRSDRQLAWMQRLTAEQDNLHAALRWAIDRPDPVLALRLGQALSWFWLLRGQHRENATMAREILAMTEPGRLAGLDAADLDVVQARAVCALTAVNGSWDITGAGQPLADAEPLVTADPGRAGGQRPPHPLVVAGVALLGLYQKQDPAWSMRILAAHCESPDPWTRSGARLMHAFFGMSTGRTEGAAAECATALAGFRVLGDRWGMGLALLGQSELAMLDGDFPRAISALEEAIGLSRELTDWEDTAQMYASLAKARSRAGDCDDALADLDRAERIAAAQGESESDLYISHVRAELAWLRGDWAQTVVTCRRLDDRMAARPAVMSWSFRALILLRAGLAELRGGSAADGRSALAEAVRLAEGGQDRSAVAAVLDALAAAALGADSNRADAERAATMLGAAHSARGAFDYGSLDAPPAREAARRMLGGKAFDAAYQQGRDLAYGEVLALARDAARLAGPAQVRRR